MNSQALYWYLTDFCVNAANMIGVSYVEFNFFLFLVLLPGVLSALFFGNVVRYLALLYRRISD